MTTTAMTTTAMTADRRRRFSAAACLLATLCLVGGGCAPNRADPAPSSVSPRNTPRRDPATRRPPQSLATDACATRLQDLGGALLLYYATNRRLPDKLEDLAAAPGAAAGAADVTCPASGRSYVYVPGGGLTAKGKGRLLVLYDPTPVHGGLRWGLFISPPSGAEPLATWVTPMSEELFRGYTAGAAR